MDILSLDKSTKFDEISAQLEIFKSKLDEIATQNNIEDEVRVKDWYLEFNFWSGNEMIL